jgi:hypothetical protein
VVGIRFWRYKTGCTMLATSLLFAPPSMTRIERVGSSSATRPAIMQPAVPPVGDQNISGGRMKGRKRSGRTSCNDDVYLIDVIREFVVDTHSSGRYTVFCNPKS